MRALMPDEKASTVMLYTSTMLIRGDIILRENMRVSIWPRTQGVPNFIHLFNVNIIQIAGATPKTYARSETFVPTPSVIGFHLAPPAQEPLDYDSSEVNRKMEPVHALAGSFEIKAKLRISTATDFSASLDVMNSPWISLYEADISNPYFQQLHVSVPMLLVRPNHILINL
ncbi:MAG: hypothetical protein HXY38_06535 [Chloroflexi bacterium]|nr:hypothetical protein [Chloroflexota bacterium]